MSLEEHHEKPLITNKGEELLKIEEVELYGMKGFKTTHRKFEEFEKKMLLQSPLRISHTVKIEEKDGKMQKIDEWELFNSADVLLSSISNMGVNHGNLKQDLINTKKSIDLIEDIHKVYEKYIERAKELSREDYKKRQESNRKSEKDNEEKYIG